MEVGIMKIYPSDLTDKQWDLLKHNFNCGNYGKSRKYPIRTLINAVFYIRAVA
ncbi:Transposase domain protein [Rickettsiales endosymbiont of Paramecium tredecaurelia]|nr:Transposase domain protein [Candidatus Sarmatiella mevalonica]